MKPFTKLKANGELRIRKRRLGEQTETQRKKGRSRSTNRILTLPRGVAWNSSEARRFRDLVRSALAEFTDPDEAALSLARTIATATLRLDKEGLAHLEFVRLSGVIARSRGKLAAMKVQVSPLPPAEIEAKAGLARLRAKLAQLAREG
jgi:hypothetical protein